MAENNQNIYYAVGVHPDQCEEYEEHRLEALLQSKDPKLVAVGEIGLDYFHNKQNKDKQIATFKSQINLAVKYNLPFIIHCRDAYGDCLTVLKEFLPFKVGVVMHCYSGSLEVAKELIKMGVKLSFTGSVTFKNAKNLQQVASSIPLESFFVETDSPYLTPEPFRGKRNEPAYVNNVAQYIADLRGVPVSQLESITDRTAKSFFKIQ